MPINNNNYEQLIALVVIILAKNTDHHSPWCNLKLAPSRPDNVTVTTSINKRCQVDPPMPWSRRLLINVYVNIQMMNQRNSQQWRTWKTPSCICSCRLCIKFEFCCGSCWKLRRVAREAHNPAWKTGIRISLKGTASSTDYI